MNLKKNWLIPFALLWAIQVPGTAWGEALTCTACGHQDYPPFMWREGDKIVGTGPDVLSSLLAAQGVSLDSLYMGNWKRCLAELKNGSVDFVVAAYLTSQRADFLEYARVPLSPDPVAVFVWQGRAFSFERWEDLIGREMGSMLGISHGSPFDLFAQQQLTNHQVNEVEQIFKQLELGRIDFFPGGCTPG